MLFGALSQFGNSRLSGPGKNTFVYYYSIGNLSDRTSLHYHMIPYVDDSTLCWLFVRPVSPATEKTLHEGSICVYETQLLYSNQSSTPRILEHSGTFPDEFGQTSHIHVTRVCFTHVYTLHGTTTDHLCSPCRLGRIQRWPFQQGGLDVTINAAKDIMCRKGLK